MGVAQNDMKEHRQSNSYECYLRAHENGKIIKLVTKEKRPKRKIQPEYSVGQKGLLHLN